MKKGTRFFFAAAVLLMTVASNPSDAMLQSSDKSSQEMVEDYENGAREMDEMIAKYQNVKPDFIVSWNLKDMKAKVRGFKDCPLQFCEYDSAGLYREQVRIYTDDTPFRLMRFSDDAIVIMFGGSTCKMVDVKQNGSTLTFRLNKRGFDAGFFSIESPYFDKVDIINSLKEDSDWNSIFTTAVKCVVVPLSENAPADSNAKM